MRVLLRVSGTVQGVGFRPQVYRLAEARALSGWVKNDARGAVIEAQGNPQALEQFEQALRDLPAPARVNRVERCVLEDQVERGFAIVASDLDERGAGTPLAADLRICESCLDELTDPANRRYRHAFIACTRCGPRYSITQSMPYDRARTSMAPFALCVECEREVRDPVDRRLHAQPIACPNCGPVLSLCAPDGEVLTAADPIEGAAAALEGGRTLALLGLGGFQLLVDATNEAAVARLRLRKQRPDKPLAIMFRDLAAVRAVCEVSAEEAEILASPAGPIVLLELRQAQQFRAARGPSSARVGALLPTTGHHQLLLNRLARPVVCTSGNASDEPLCASASEARERLGTIADLFLTHDRAVVHAVDDSVGQWGAFGFQLLRRARGYVPEATASVPSNRQVLALGAHQKHTFTLTCEGQAFTSPHLGDLESPLARSRLERTVREWLELLRLDPELVVCDAHPGYASTELGEELAASWGVPLLRIQHHHAHVAAAMAEWGASGAVLGLAWDGSGFGSDGTLWGGEVLLCEGTATTRVGHLLPFQLPGGVRAIVEPWRAALGLLHRAGRWQRARELEGLLPAEVALSTLDVIERALVRGVNAPFTSSIGRLFDAVAASCGVRRVCSFEGQAAMEWMTLAESGAATSGEYPLEVNEDGIIDWRPLFDAVLEDRSRGARIENIARRFHHALASSASFAAQRTGAPTVALTGGCFQNRLLAELCRQRLEREGFRVLIPRRVPPNDGGISLGQAWLACQANWSPGVGA